MTGDQFKRWRKKHNFTLAEAAEELGISERMTNYYQSGEKVIPRSIWLATLAIDAGLHKKKKK